MVKVFTALLFVCLSPLSIYAQAQNSRHEQKEARSNNKSKEFLGIFFIETYPVTGCEIIKIRPSVIRSTTEFRAPEREEFNNDRNFSKVMHKYQGDLIDEAKSIAEKEGYNAIIGSKFLVNTHYQVLQILEQLTAILAMVLVLLHILGIQFILFVKI